MPKQTVFIKNKLGLHARAASQIVNLASQYTSEVTIQKGNVTANGKSLLGILTLDAPLGSELLIDVNGSDAQELLTKLVELIENKFGEKN
ncbi:MAG: HPr family phosphocarrier protein [bacterium]|nr:HPr family phosphocarrier protein [bacterium]